MFLHLHRFVIPLLYFSTACYLMDLFSALPRAKGYSNNLLYFGRVLMLVNQRSVLFDVTTN